MEFPLPAQPMLVCYWARWADSVGEVSRFSNTCVARLEGWTPTPGSGSNATAAMPAGADRTIVGTQDAPRLEAQCVIVQLPYAETLLAEGFTPESTEPPEVIRLLDAA